MKEIIGKYIGRYHILEKLGRGGMATVFKAYDTRLERDVAIKIIRREAFPAENYDRILKRFEREAKSMAKLSHPNIVKVHDYGKNEGSPYLVLEYLPGGNLKQHLGEPMPWQQAVQLLLPVTRALAFAHDEGFIHRDVKPSNILITKNGEPMLTDFGIAKLFAMDDTQTLTATGVGVGTPAYMAPEQGMGKEIDPRADIYALGIVLYELMTGRKPFEADTPMATVFKHMSDPLPAPSRFVADIPEQVEKVLIKALAKQPENRHKDMRAFGQALTKLLTGQSSTRRVFDLLQESDQLPISEDADSTRDELIEMPTEQRRTDRLLDGKKNVWAKRSLIGVGVVAVILAIVMVSSRFVDFWPITTEVMENTEAANIVESTVTTKQEITPTTGAKVQATQELTATIQETVAGTKTPTVEWVEGDVLFEEDFEDGRDPFLNIHNGSDGKGKWEVLTDQTGNKVYQSNNLDGVSYPSVSFGNQDWGNYVVSFRIKFPENTWESEGGITFRNTSIDHYELLLLSGKNEIEFAYYDQSGRYRVTLSSQVLDIFEDQWYSVRVEMIGSQIKFYVNGHLLDMVSDSKISTGNMSIRANPNTYVQFDDIKVIAIDEQG